MRLRAKSSFLDRLNRCRTDLHRFSREIMLFEPTGQQSELFDRVQFETWGPMSERLRGIGVASGQGCGKTSAGAVIAAWRLLQARGAKVVITAPTMRQVRDIWMGELDIRVNNADPELRKFIKVTSTNATVCGDRSWKLLTMTSSRPENVQGQHRSRMTIIADEASGIERPIWPTLKGTLTEPDNLLIATGNPNERDTEFFDMFHKDLGLYHTLNWSSEDSPKVDKANIEKLAAEYGRDSDIFRVRVLGLFPRENAQSVIRYEDLLYACRHKVKAEAMRTPTSIENGRPTKQIGIDLARFGGDESSITVRYNSAVLMTKHFMGAEPIDVLAYAMDLQKQLNWRNEDTVYCVDAGGMGQGVMKVLYNAGKRVFEFLSNGTPFETNIYKDQITEAYFALRHLTRKKELYIVRDDKTFNQLVSRQYRYDKDLFRLESKDEFIERIGRYDFNSPDRADSMVLACYPHSRMQMITGGRR